MFRLDESVRRFVVRDAHLVGVPFELDFTGSQGDSAQLNRFGQTTGVFKVAQRRRLAAVDDRVDPFAMMPRRRGNRLRRSLIVFVFFARIELDRTIVGSENAFVADEEGSHLLGIKIAFLDDGGAAIAVVPGKG